MAKLSVLAGATSQSVNVFVQDSSSTTGAGLASIAPAGGSLLTGTKLYYSFTGTNASAGVAVSLAVLAAVNSAWSSAGIVQLDNTNMIGWVRVDLPNAALATSKGRVVSFLLFGGTNMAPCPFEVELTGWDNQDGVHGGLTSLPNTAVTTNASLLTSGTGTDQLSVATGRIDAGKILGTAISTPATAGILDVNVKNMNNVAGTSITTINANQGTTQPLNFTGTAGSALVKSDMVDVAGSAVSTSTAQIGTNVVSFAAGQDVALRRGTAGAGAASTITLDGSASATDSLYNGASVAILSGTGVGQDRVITGYVGSTKVATVSRAWTTNPDNTSVFAVLPSEVDVETWLRTAVTAASAGIPDVNAKAINNVAATSVTTINANVGQTQPVNYTGTGASALVKIDAIDWASGAIPAVNVTGVPLVDLKYTLGTISPATAGSVRADSVTGAVGSVTGNVGGSVASVTAAVAITSNIKKNQALTNFEFLMTDSTNHNPVTGKTVTCTRSIDGGAFGAGTLANVAEVSNGFYRVDFGAGDLNGTVIVLRATAASSDDTFERIVTQP